jgi:HlyD family secretion protein
MNKIKTITIAATLLLMTSCNNNKSSFDASGSFEAEETIISSEATGTIKQFDIEEGQTLKAGEHHRLH